jgi:hypothetical protein
MRLCKQRLFASRHLVTSLLPTSWFVATLGAFFPLLLTSNPRIVKGLFFDFDHYKMMQSYLDFATWDNYPLGFLAISWLADKLKAQYGQIGHPVRVNAKHAIDIRT